ncbi:MAG: neprosin family prolyl endopeptidase [Actinoplanes sp.]
MGVVWTFNANADETPEAEVPAAATASVAPAEGEVAPAEGEVASAEGEAARAEEEVAPAAETSAPAARKAERISQPPKLLPWGAKPTKLKRARTGASSAAIAAAGADFAPADSSGSLVPKAEFGPKGRQYYRKLPKTPRATPVPPAPPAVGTAAKAAVGEEDFNFFYQGAHQFGVTDGTWANLTIEKPTLHKDDNHTLTEITVQSADGRQIVEFGWNVDREVNGNAEPHMFVFYWYNGVPKGYNADFNPKPGASTGPGPKFTLPASDENTEVSKRFGIQHNDGAWWFAYDREWLGSIPDDKWGGTFTRGGLTQWFGEVATLSDHPCTQMGNGLLGTNGKAARIGTIALTNGPEVNPVMRDAIPGYNADLRPGNVTFRFGGPGPGVTKPDGTCVAPTTPPTTPPSS